MALFNSIKNLDRHLVFFGQPIIQLKNSVIYDSNFFKSIEDDSLVFIDVSNLELILNDIILPKRIILLVDNDFDCKSISYKAIFSPINYKIELKNINVNTRLFQGKEFIMLNENLRSIRKKSIKINIRKVLLSLGGSNRFYKTIYSIHNDLQREGLITNIISNDKRIKDGKFYNKIEQYFRQISDSDLIITSSGQSIYECMYLNKLILPIALTKNQKINLDDLISKGLFKFKLSLSNENNHEIIKDFLIYYNNRNNLNEYYNKLNGFLDINGTKRVAQKIKSFIDDK